MGRAADMEGRVGGCEGNPDAASRQPPQPTAPAEVLLELQRRAGNASVARWLGSASHRPLQRDELTISPQMPETEAGALREAWALLKELDARPASADEIARVASIAHTEHIEFLGEGMLERIRATPNTRLVVSGGLTDKRRQDEAGGTRLIAKFADRTEADVGYGAAETFSEFMKSVPKEARKQVQFQIRFDILIPYFEWARKREHYGVAYFLETLTHELALHGEAYADRIVRWRESKEPWTPTFEYSEHQEHMYAGNPRYMLLLRRLYEAAAAQVPGVPPELLTALERELEESRTVYTKEGMTPPEEPTAVAQREMLDWIAELKQGLSEPEPEPEQSPQIHGEAPMLEPLPQPQRKSRLRRLLDRLAGCIRRPQPD
jgi:hypothetical protein